MTESPQQSSSNINYQSESNIYSDELTERNPEMYSSYIEFKDSFENIKSLKEGKSSKDSILMKSNTIKQLYNSISRDINLIENLTKSDKELIDPASYSNDQSETLFITNQNIEISDYDKENIKLEENGNNINGILFRTDSMSKLYKDIMNNNDLSTDSSTIDKTAVDKTLISDTPLKKEIYNSGSKDYYLSEVFTYPNSSDNNKQFNDNKPKRKLNRNSSIDKRMIASPNLPSILRRSSSLNKKKDIRNKFIQSDYNETIVDDKVDVDSEFEPTQIESELHESEKINKNEENENTNEVEKPEKTNKVEKIEKIEKTDVIEHPEKINKEEIIENIKKENNPENVNNIENDNEVEKPGIPNIAEKVNEVKPIDDSNTNNLPSKLDEIGNEKSNNQVISILPMIPRRRSSMSKKRKSFNVRNNVNTTEAFSVNKSNPINVPNVSGINNNNNINIKNNIKDNRDIFKNYKMFNINDHISNKRHSIDVINTSKNYDDDSDLYKTPKLNSPAVVEESPTSTSNSSKTPTSYSSSKSYKRHTISPLSIEIPDRPENMVKHKSSRMSKIFKTLTPKTSSSHMSKKSSKSEKLDEFPGKILFGEDDEDDSEFLPGNTKGKRFSIIKLKNKVMKKASRESYKKNKDYSSPEKIVDNEKRKYRHSIATFNVQNTELTDNATEPTSEMETEVSISPFVKSNINNYYKNRRISHPLIHKAEVPSSPIVQKAEVPNSPLIQKAEMPSSPLIQKAEIPSSPLIQKAEVPSSPLIQKAEVPSSPLIQKAEIPSSPLIQKAEIPSSPLIQKAEVPSSPLIQKAEVPSSPIVKKAEMANSPLIQKAEMASSPLTKPQLYNKKNLSASSFEIIKPDMNEKVLGINGNNKEGINKIDKSSDDDIIEIKEGEILNEEDGEWIDESVYDIKGKNNPLKDQKNKIKQRKNTHKRKYSRNVKMNINREKSNAKFADTSKLSNSSNLDKNSGRFDRRDISHGSIHYARTTNKYTVIKPRASPIQLPIPERISSSRVIEQSPLSNEIQTNNNTQDARNQSIVIAEPQLLSPNHSFTISKADMSFSSMASRASSVKMKRNIMKKFFHINLKKRQNKQNANKKKKNPSK